MIKILTLRCKFYVFVFPEKEEVEVEATEEVEGELSEEEEGRQCVCVIFGVLGWNTHV